MKIKNIRQFRTFFKEIIEEQTQANRNEHFVGQKRDLNDNKEFGWFNIYHGRKDIENFLQGFLEMAGDGQAIYEFLQNAVDAGSSHFYMKWEKDIQSKDDYLMICNNGSVFDVQSIISILNVGESTKHKNVNAIGQYGIGFKLAHKLVGSSNGLQELTKEYQGPILFSWNSTKQLEDFVRATEIEPTEFSVRKNGNSWVSDDVNPWLFKMLITCFPVLPKNNLEPENVIDLEGRPIDNLFTQEELSRFQLWVRNVLPILKSKNYSQGSIVFIRLGEGKKSVFSTRELQSGIHFSLGILDELKKGSNHLSEIQFNNEKSIHKPDLEYEKFSIKKDAVHGLPSEKIKSDVEFIMGFRHYKEIDKYFDSKPNFFLFFPLSAEVHNLDFIIHCNHFDKSSSRTHLQHNPDKAGLNELLFKALISKIDRRLKQYSENKNEKFLDMYAAILSSGLSSSQDRKWVADCFIKPLNKLLQKYIPCKLEDKFDINKVADTVVILKTELDLNLEQCGISGMKWFFYDDKLLVRKAKHKLDLKDFTIGNILDAKDSYKVINQWIARDSHKAILIAKEINEILPFNEHKLKLVQKQNFLNISFIEFTDGKYFSLQELNDLEEVDRLIVYSNLKSILPILDRLGIITSRIDFDKYANIEKLNYLSNEFQFRNKTSAIEIINKNCDHDILDKISLRDRLEVFEVLVNRLGDQKIAKGGRIQLFKNSNSQFVPLNQILSDSIQDTLLSKFKISKADSNPILQKYTCNNDRDIYNQIIYKQWTKLLEISKSLNDKDSFYEKVKSYIQEDDKKLLSDHNIVVFNNHIEDIGEDKAIFFHENLSTVSSDQFLQIQSLLKERGFGILPDQYQMKYLSERPWGFSSKDLVIDGIDLNENELSLIVEVDNCCKLNLFNKKLISEKEGDLYQVSELDGQIKQYAIENDSIRIFAETYLAHKVQLLPKNLLEFEIQNIPGIKKFVKDIGLILNDEIDQTLSNAWIQNVSLLSTDDQKSFFNEVKQIYFFWKDETGQNRAYLSLVKNLLKEGADLSFISSKIVVCGFGVNIQLRNVTDILDTIKIQVGEHDSVKVSKSKVLLEEGKDQLNSLNELLTELVSEDILTEYQLRKLLKLDEEIRAVDITDRFFEVLNENDHIVENTDQLIFLLANRNIVPSEISNYQLYNINGSISDLVGLHFLSSDLIDAIISSDSILDERYKDLQLRLFPQQSQVSLKVHKKEADHSEAIYFIHEIDHNVPLTGELMSPELSCARLMSAIQELFKKNKESLWYWDFESIFATLELIPKEYSRSPRYENEKIPQELSKYSDELLKLIGVDFHKEDVDLLHEYLTGKSNKRINVDLLDQIPEVFLINILKQISNIETLISFELLSDRYDLLIGVYFSLINRGSLLSAIKTVPCHITKAQVVLRELIESQYYFNEEDWSIVNQAYDEPNVFSALRIIPNDLSSEFPNLGNRIIQIHLQTVIKNEGIVELADERYLEWKEDYDNLKIFKINGRPDLGIVYKNEDIECYQENLLVGEYYLEESAEYSYNLYFDNTIITPTSILEGLGNHNISFSLEEYLTIHKDQMASFAEYLLNPEKSGLSDDEHEELLRIRKEKEQKEARTRLVNSLTVTKKYSFKWFIDYIQTLIFYDSSDKSQKQQTIVFDKISTYAINDKINRRYAHLKGPSRVISQRIQEYQDVRLLLKFKGEKSKDITLTSVSTKGQSLVVLYPQGFQELIGKFPDLVQAKLTFTPIIDLRERLFRAFKEELSENSWNEIKDVLPKLNYIYGPPGTGKTFTLCTFLKEKVLENPFTKALMVGPTNKAADVLVKRLYRDFDIENVLRVGSISDPELNEINDTIYKLDLEDSDLFNNLVATTVHRLPYFSVNDEPLYMKDNHWDYLIIDEASMVSVEYIVFVILSVKKYNPECKVIIAGDPKQIPPVVNVSDKELEQLEIEELNIYRMMNISEIKTAMSNVRDIDKIDVLTKQYRSIESIGNLYSQYGYQGILSTNRMNDPGFNLNDKFKILNSPVTFIDIPLDRGETVVQVGKLNRSPYHLYCALLVVEILRDLGKHLENRLSVGIVTPYKSQAVIVERLITSADLSEKLDVTCDTVHGFQGDEKKLIIFIVNPNNYKYTGHEKALLSKQYIYNVAISRSEDKLWILHPKSDLENRNYHVDKLFNIEFARFNGIKYVDSKDIEKILFNKEDYIRTNSYITSHDSVNVYGLVDMGYFIKVSSSAVDIQIQGGRSILENER